MKASRRGILLPGPWTSGAKWMSRRQQAGPYCGEEHAGPALCVHEQRLNGYDGGAVFPAFVEGAL